MMHRLLSKLLAGMLLICLLPGCGKPAGPDNATPPSRSASHLTAETVLTTWEQGDSAGAIKQVLEADWSTGPLFAPGSAMNLSENQFKQLPASEREAKAAEMQARLSALRKLAGAVTQAGREAAAKEDLALARKHFTALNQLGAALDSQDSPLLVQLVGQALKKTAATENAKLPR